VKLSTEKYQKLAKEADQLRTENKSLSRQLQELQDLVAKFLPSKAKAGTAGTILMVMVLSFSLFLVPLTPDSSLTGGKLGKGSTTGWLGYSVGKGLVGNSRNTPFSIAEKRGGVDGG